MTKQVTTTFSVQVRSLWHEDGDATNADLANLERATVVRDEEGNIVAFFAGKPDAQSACTDHNRTTRQRAKQREHRKSDAKSGHEEHSEEGDDESFAETVRKEANAKLNKDRVVKCKCGHTNVAHEFAEGKCDDCKCTQFISKK